MRESRPQPKVEIQTLPYVLTLKQVLILSFFIALVSWAAQSPLIKPLISPTFTTENQNLHFSEIKLTLPHHRSEIKKISVLATYNRNFSRGNA